MLVQNHSNLTLEQCLLANIDLKQALVAQICQGCRTILVEMIPVINLTIQNLS